jgi:DNA replication protein DnaC
VAITTNLVFSEWTRIFKDPMTTLAAIDRVVHHAVILDLMGMDSYRAMEAGMYTNHDQRPPSPPPSTGTPK